MKRARKVIRFLSIFPEVPGRVWVDAYSIIALIKFALGKPIDVGTLGVILGTYAVSSVAKKYMQNTPQTGNPDAE